MNIPASDPTIIFLNLIIFILKSTHWYEVYIYTEKKKGMYT